MKYSHTPAYITRVITNKIDIVGMVFLACSVCVCVCVDVHAFVCACASKGLCLFVCALMCTHA